MRKLIRFIEKYSFFFLFLLFEVIAFYLLFQKNHYQRASFLSNSKAVTGELYSQFSTLTNYLHLRTINEKLAEENNRLHHRQLRSFEKLYGPNVLIDDTLYQQQYLYTKARIINNSTNKQNNYLTLNVGRNNGIEVGMGVISSNGIVGIVVDVSKHYATVLSMLHSSTKISVKLKDKDYFGSMQWDGKSYRQGVLMDIPNHVDIAKGDTIISSGYSAIFPANITVGTIEHFEQPKGENFYDIRLNFTTNFKSLRYVYIIKNKWGEEQKELEEKTIKENG